MRGSQQFALGSAQPRVPQGTCVKRGFHVPAVTAQQDPQPSLARCHDKA
jgi:hypothetical protein